MSAPQVDRVIGWGLFVIFLLLVLMVLRTRRGSLVWWLPRAGVVGVGLGVGVGVTLIEIGISGASG